MEVFRNKIINFIQSTFTRNDTGDEVLQRFDDKYYNDVVDSTFKALTKDKKPQEKPLLIKLGAQSGSGKTTQLLPAITTALNKNNIDYVHLAVRLFVKNHPHYRELLEKYGESLIREKTNAFALFCCFGVMEKLIKNKFNIFWEITLLAPDFEEYIIRLAKKYNYKILFNIISIPLEISNTWIKDRSLNSNYEKNRVVLDNTANFFYNILGEAIKRILMLKDIFDDGDYMVMWNVFEKKPILISNNFNENIIELFNKNRIFVDGMLKKVNDEKVALNYKTEFYDKFLSEF
ncbi:MAG: zeta toxin family protein [Rickettsiales bacterium]|nr:zeta toxin family protein [Rickettsiales bacterium]